MLYHLNIHLTGGDFGKLLGSFRGTIIKAVDGFDFASPQSYEYGVGYDKYIVGEFHRKRRNT